MNIKSTKLTKQEKMMSDKDLMSKYPYKVEFNHWNSGFVRLFKTFKGAEKFYNSVQDEYVGVRFNFTKI
jgi:hypothetical protein